MKTKVISTILVLIFSVSIVACGTTNGASATTVENDPIQSETDEYQDLLEETTESAIEVEEVEETEAEPVGEPYTGDLYTLPVAKQGEEWTEAQLDDYLASCKAYKKAFDGETFDFDVFMTALGFEYEGTESDIEIFNRYYRERGNCRIMCCALYEDAQVYTFVDNGKETVLIREFQMDYDKTVTMLCRGMKNDEMSRRISVISVKGIAASLDYLVCSRTIDCARLPYHVGYGLEYGGDGGILSRDYNPVETPIKTDNRVNPYLY